MIPIVIASVLKPTDEVRMYKRIGTSLAKTNKYDVNIIGIESKNRTATIPNVKHHSLTRKGRNPLPRLLNLVQTQKLITEIKPKIVIVTSPDLLYMVTHHRYKSSFKVIYDLQEDYYKNITNQRVYPSLIKRPLASLIRAFEKRSLKNIEGIWLAETTYTRDISFVRNTQNALVLENRYHGTLHSKREYTPGNLHLLFTGTVSTYSGVQQAINVYQAISLAGQKVHLTIVGICYEQSVRNQLRELSKMDPNITLVGIHEFVPHDEITHWFERADIAIIGYRPDEINADKIPSKLYEYLAYQLPVIVDTHSHWKALLAQSNLDIAVDFDKISGADLLVRYQNIMNSAEVPSSANCLWSSIEQEMLHFISTLY